MPTKDVQTFPTKTPLEAVRADLAVLVTVTIKSGHAVKQGDVIGIITASKLGRRRTRTLAAGTGFAVDSAVGRVDDASVFKAADVLKNVAGTTIGTVLSVDPSTNPDTVTLTANAAVAVAAGAAVLGSDGSQVAKAISDHETDGQGDTPVSVFISGFLKESLLRGLDSTAIAELAGALVAGGIFKF